MKLKLIKDDEKIPRNTFILSICQKALEKRGYKVEVNHDKNLIEILFNHNPNPDIKAP